ncbi:putative ornithine decarboxylase [Companilactobacillus sp.]|jgi:ornithine decarboxylase|uniref:putative ornithine decarboxylase n=1 Tax=Companilactobacillus sp. TaxID=2767905 RepID=UPI0025C08EF3|nr:putative ornithine decarboxylase [Companilactobacillus sp.]MCH4008711.1 putative ornithine decarboxylase [Companilactobacillus sp.]MCH4051110.1 putative ornithine decarboxylase [Companilactobacillus sp.]MCH4076654.1 putative ornithine decarboxylase [Companilactobacillus sp.]MCH4125229.1 putative ornithine decarboxylase [Companilactobacillus sp.]MCH4131769.1 putative ornithine decarboxylase [Companilactobacillus sp.]
MNFLKIAISNDANQYIPSGWNVVSFNEHVDPATLAAIVLDNQNKTDIQAAQDLQKTSGLGIPIITIDSKDDIKSVQSEITAKIKDYENKVVPGFLTDLIDFTDRRPISFTTPGHHNGQYYDKHPAGVIFNRFFGKNLMFADTSDTVDQLGDTMTHGGTPLTAEQKAAKTYNADKVYFCTNGTTSSNSICASALLTEGDLVLFDRNNHKSLYNSALVMSGAKPVYIPTDRNALGLIGEMDPKFLTEDKIRAEIAKVDPEKAKQKRPFRLAVLQLETYDGVFYDAKWIIDRIGKLCDYILFDCAWGGFEQFVPIMKHLSPLSYNYGPDDPGILVTQSLHKQQAGLAQTSQILKKDSHLKGQARYVDHKHFNNAYLKFVTSSYSYPIYASLTVNAYVTSGPSNIKWWDEMLRMGIEWRKKLLEQSKLFKPLIPDDFENLTTDQLATQAKYWEMNGTQKWHGFSKMANGEAMFDPLKITVKTPGIDVENSQYEETGIPGPVVAEYLMEHNIIRAKDDLNSLLFLLTPGDTKEELDQLLAAFLEFEHYYLNDTPLAEVLPELASRYPKRYTGYTLKQLCQEMHEYYQAHQTFRLQKELFAKPNMQNYQMTPEQADRLFMKNQSELVDLDKIEGRVAMEGALPYPPGVFIVAPGEKWQKIDQEYFEVLVGAIERFPGFVPEIQGVYWDTNEDGTISVQAEVLKNK